MEIIRADQISPNALADVDAISMTDGIVVTAIWKRRGAGKGKHVWIAVRELTPDHINPVIDRLVGLGLGADILPERWWSND